MRTYRFNSVNAGTVEITVTGEYRDSTAKDIDVLFDGGERFFLETDDPDEIMQWLVDSGVEFQSDRSMAYNRAVIGGVLMDGETTLGALLEKAEAWTDGQVAQMLDGISR